MHLIKLLNSLPIIKRQIHWVSAALVEILHLSLIQGQNNPALLGLKISVFQLFSHSSYDIFYFSFQPFGQYFQFLMVWKDILNQWRSLEKEPQKKLLFLSKPSKKNILFLYKPFLLFWNGILSNHNAKGFASRKKRPNTSRTRLWIISLERQSW